MGQNYTEGSPRESRCGCFCDAMASPTHRSRRQVPRVRRGSARDRAARAALPGIQRERGEKPQRTPRLRGRGVFPVSLELLNVKRVNGDLLTSHRVGSRMSPQGSRYIFKGEKASVCFCFVVLGFRCQ